MRNVVSKSYEWKHAKIKESVKESYMTSISVMHTVFQSFANISSANSRRKRMLKLYIEEMQEGCRLGIDT